MYSLNSIWAICPDEVLLDSMGAARALYEATMRRYGPASIFTDLAKAHLDTVEAEFMHRLEIRGHMNHSGNLG